MNEPSFNRPHGPITIAELTAGLVWPRLLRGFTMSLRPSRVFVGTVAVALMWGLAALLAMLTQKKAERGAETTGTAERVLADIGDGVGGAARQLVRLDFDAAWRSLDLALTSFSVQSGRGWEVLLACVVLLPVWLVAGGAISRSAAVEIAAAKEVTVFRTLVFALLRLGTMLRAVLLPLGLVAVVSLLIKAAGWVLFSWEGVSVIGAVLYPLMVLGGLVVTLVWIGFFAGSWLLVPAIAVENTDATDAVQRAYSYVFGRPARTSAYAVVVVAVGAVGLVLVNWLVGASVGVAKSGASAWLEAERVGVVVSPGTRDGLSAWIMEAWGWLLGCIAAGWAVSYIFSASTLLYLLLRRVHDEQDPSEVWMPGGSGAGGVDAR
jgi:hypothetical protein